ncbi:hypothetical protein Tco_1170851 [Tanacetum coccineum]
MEGYGFENVTLNPTQVFSVQNCTLKKNKPEGPPFTDHMLAVCKADVPVEHKAPNTSSYTRKKDFKGKKPEAKSRHRKQPTSKHYPLSKIKATKVVGLHKEDTSEGGANPQLSSAKSKVRADSGLSAHKDSISQTTSNDEGPNKLSPDHISAGKGASAIAKRMEEEFNTSPDLSSSEDTQKEIKLEDLSSEGEEEDEEIHAIKHTETTTTLAPQPLSPSSLPTKLKELPSKLNELTGEVKELNKHVHELEIELPRDLKEIPNNLEAKLKTLDVFPSLLNKVTEALNKFAQVINSASQKT